MEILIAVFCFTAVMGAASYFAYRRYQKTGKLLRQLGKPVAGGSSVVVQTRAEAQQSPLGKVLENLGRQAPLSGADANDTRKELFAAGFRNENAIFVFSGLRIVLAVVFLFLSLGLRSKAPSAALGVALVGLGAFLGYRMPGIYLDKAAKKRRETLRLSLPDALDLMVVSIEAGLGLDQAVHYVGRELQMTHKELADELSLITLEMRAGKRRSEALKNFAERTGEDEIRKLTAILVQNDRFGTSMGESLRTHSDYMRVRRRQDAEERAGKVGVKLVFPIFLFILPSMLIVAAGPGLLQVFKNLFPMMQNFGK